MLAFQITPYEGTAPGTTTLNIDLNGGLGVCPPGHYGPAIMLPGSAPMPEPYGPEAKSIAVWPYTDAGKLKGLGAATRWDLLALTFGAAFATVLGVAWWRSRK